MDEDIIAIWGLDAGVGPHRDHYCQCGFIEHPDLPGRNVAHHDQRYGGYLHCHLGSDKFVYRA